MAKKTTIADVRQEADNVVITIDFSKLQLRLGQFFSSVGRAFVRIMRFIANQASLALALKLTFTTAVALIIGFGLAVTVLQNPSSVEAQPGLVQTKPVLLARTLTWNAVEYPITVTEQDLGMLTLLPSGTISLVKAYGSLNDVTPVMLLIGRGHELSKPLQELSLGSTITLLADNGGLYSYTLLRTQTVLRKDLPAAYTNNGYAVGMAIPLDRLQTQYQILWWQ